MRIATEGPDLSAVNFDEVLDIFTGKSDCRLYSCVRIINKGILGVGDLPFGVGYPPPPPPPPPPPFYMKHCDFNA